VNFYETEVGSPGAVFPPSQRVRVPFAFSTPVQTVHAVLRSFHLEVGRKDSEVRDVVVILTPRFDPLQSTTSGVVEVEFQRTDSSGAGFLGLQSDTIEAQIRILVIGF
jgi:hypothetical protein